MRRRKVVIPSAFDPTTLFLFSFKFVREDDRILTHYSYEYQGDLQGARSSAEDHDVSIERNELCDLGEINEFILMWKREVWIHERKYSKTREYQFGV